MDKEIAAILRKQNYCIDEGKKTSFKDVQAVLDAMKNTLEAQDEDDLRMEYDKFVMVKTGGKFKVLIEMGYWE